MIRRERRFSAERLDRSVALTFTVLLTIILVTLIAVFAAGPRSASAEEVSEADYGDPLVHSGVTFNVGEPEVVDGAVCSRLLVDNSSDHPVEVDDGPWSLDSATGDRLRATSMKSERPPLVVPGARWDGSVCFRPVSTPTGVRLTVDDRVRFLWR